MKNVKKIRNSRCVVHRGKAVRSRFTGVRRPQIFALPGQSGRASACRQCQLLASSCGPVRANGIPAAACGMGTHGRVGDQRSAGESAALPRRMRKSSSQQQLLERNINSGLLQIVCCYNFLKAQRFWI